MPTLVTTEYVAATGNHGQHLLGHTTDPVTQCKPPLFNANTCWDVLSGNDQQYSTWTVKNRE